MSRKTESARLPPQSSLAQRAAYWDRHLDPLDWTHAAEDSQRAWSRAHHTFWSAETREAAGWLEPLAGLRLLELGCGQGHGSVHLARRGPRLVVGLDLAPRRCAVARRQATRRAGLAPPVFCAGDAARLPFAAGSFDRVFCRDVLMYADPSFIARECERVLAAGGKVAFVESLRGHAALRCFRRLTSPPQYRGFTRHLSWNEMTRAGEPLRLVRRRAYHVLGVLGFACLFLLRSERLHRSLLALLEPLDRRLLRRFPRLAEMAWRAGALYEKPFHAD